MTMCCTRIYTYIYPKYNFWESRVAKGVYMFYIRVHKPRDFLLLYSDDDDGEKPDGKRFFFPFYLLYIYTSLPAIWSLVPIKRKLIVSLKIRPRVRRLKKKETRLKLVYRIKGHLN